MKTIYYFAIMALTFVALTGCGNKENKENNENNDAILTPETTKVRGDLKEYFTVVEKQYTIKCDEQNFGGKYMVSIELQRTDVPFVFDIKGVEPVGHFGASVRGNYGIGIDIMDADGNIAISWSPTADGMSGVYSSDDLENLFTLESGERGRVRWTTNEFEKYENKNFTFKVSSYLTVKECTAKNFMDDESGEAYWTGKVDGKHAVHMSLWWKDSNLLGAYYYDKIANGIHNYLKLTGEVIENHVVMTEQNKYGVVTGRFEGDITGKVYQGNFIRAKDGKIMPFSLNYIGCENDSSFVAPVEFEDEFASTPSLDNDEVPAYSSANWDEILDEYERYVNQYIKVLKKAENGDVTAMTEMVELLEQCNELFEKIETAKGELSTAQAARFSKIAMKAAGQMQ